MTEEPESPISGHIAGVLSGPYSRPLSAEGS